jgi:hypothetical protein
MFVLCMCFPVLTVAYHISPHFEIRARGMSHLHLGDILNFIHDWPDSQEVEAWHL